jgi:hypothetical protein
MRRAKRLLIYSVPIFAFVLLSTCQAVFTFSIFKGVEADPSKLSVTELIHYGWDVIAAGDEAKMTSTLAAMKAIAPGNPTNGQLFYVAANIDLALSRVAYLFTNPPKDTSPAGLLAYQAAYFAQIRVPNLEEASMLYILSMTNGIQLNAVDYVFTGIGQLLTTTANDLNQLGLLIPATIVPPRDTYVSLYYNVGLAKLSSTWQSVIKGIYTPLL